MLFGTGSQLTNICNDKRMKGKEVCQLRTNMVDSDDKRKGGFGHVQATIRNVGICVDRHVDRKLRKSPRWKERPDIVTAPTASTTGIAAKSEGMEGAIRLTQ